MDPSNKRPRLEEWIRISDGFRRTEMNVICPVMKAENSVRVLYRLQKEMLTEAIQEAGDSIGLTFENIHYVSEAAAEGAEGNLFVKFKNPLPNDGKFCSKFRKRLERRLARKMVKVNGKATMVKDFVVDRVQDARKTIPQPIISEYDFEMHKLYLCLRELDRIKDESPERVDFSILGENIKSYLEELSKSYTKFAVLSQNGKGKSFILNLLLLMTADNEEEYSANNRNLKVPEDFPDNTLVNNLSDTDLQTLPVVVREVLDVEPLEDNDQDFKSLMQPICHQLENVANIETSLEGFSGIGDYFTNKKRLDIEPYFLSQKEIEVAYESTTKCIIHLRYGTLYEMKVEYFGKSELQQQLYELFTMENECKDEDEDAKETAQACLTERFKILTEKSPSEMKDNFNSPDDIIFSPEVLEFAGKTELYFGQGKSPIKDRIALQSVLRGLTIPQEEDDAENEIYKKRISSVKNIVVYLPCKILYGGKEILEMPGTDDSDPIAMNFITDVLNKVDAVILVTEYGFKLCEKEVKTMLSKSRFVQNFKEEPNKHKVMLLAYPEKSSKWQFGSGDENKIKALEENRKRNVELETMRKILKLDTLPDSLKERISTSYILPVLHTSILAQECKPEHEVISRYHDTFLKHTGIQELIANVDELVLSRQSSIFNEVKRELNHFHNEVNGDTSVEDARCIVKLLSDRSYKALTEQDVTTRFKKIEDDLFKKMENKLSEDVSTMIMKIFDTRVPQAIERWKRIEPRVESIGVFSPYFAGKNPRYRVCLYDVLFEDLENDNMKIFQRILQMIQRCLQDYKEKAIRQCAEELNTLLDYQDRPATFTSIFVEGAIGEQIDDVLKWYQGKKQRPFNQKSMEKYMDKSQKTSLKDVILEPNFKRCSVEKAKEKTGQHIEECISKVHENFIYHLIYLHKQRRKNLSKKLQMPNKSSRIWQQLILYLKSLSREAGGENYKEDISNLITTINASFI